MSKKRRIRGEAREIIYFIVQNFSAVAYENPEVIAQLKELFFEIGVSVLEFETRGGSLGVISEGQYKASIPEMYKVMDSLGLKANYSRSEFV